MALTRAEQETVIQWDDETKCVHLYTASPVTKRRLEKKGWTFTETSRDSRGLATGWVSEAPQGAVTFRRLQSGAIAKRKLASTAFQAKGKMLNPRDVAILGGDPSL